MSGPIIDCPLKIPSIIWISPSVPGCFAPVSTAAFAYAALGSVLWISDRICFADRRFDSALSNISFRRASFEADIFVWCYFLFLSLFSISVFVSFF